MIKLEIKSNVKETIERLKYLAKDQLPFASAKALTKTAQLVKKELEAELPRVFKNPTPWTLKSLYLTSAKKNKLSARVWLKDDAFKGIPASRYLSPQIFSGERVLKRFERSLAAKGILPPGYFAVPGSAAQLDQYGNINRGQITKILSALKASHDPHQNRSNRGSKMKKSKQPQYFVGKPGNGPLGIWQRFPFAFGSAVKPIIIFVRNPRYRQRLDFFGIAERTINANFETEFINAINDALATRR